MFMLGSLYGTTEVFTYFVIGEKGLYFWFIIPIIYFCLAVIVIKVHNKTESESYEKRLKEN